MTAAAIGTANAASISTMRNRSNSRNTLNIECPLIGTNRLTSPRTENAMIGSASFFTALSLRALFGLHEAHDRHDDATDDGNEHQLHAERRVHEVRSRVPDADLHRTEAEARERRSGLPRLRGRLRQRGDAGDR